MPDYVWPFENVIKGYKIPFNPNGASYQNIDIAVDEATIRGAFGSMNMKAMDRNTLTRLALNGALR